MKKILIFCLALLISFPVFAKDITITLDGNEIKSDVAAYIKDDRTLVPIRFISEKLGYDVAWEESSRMVTISNSSTKIQLVIDSKDIIVNGKTLKMDVAPVITKDRTFVPLRFVAEYMGLGVDWDANSYTVILKTLKSDSAYINEISSLLEKLNSKTDELKAYFYKDASKYTREEIETQFNNLKVDIDNIISDIKSINVPTQNSTSHKLIIDATDIINSVLNQYKAAILDGDAEQAKKLVELQTELAVKLHEASRALQSEKSGTTYVPDVDSQIYNRAKEIDKNENPLEDELIQNLLKKI